MKGKRGNLLGEETVKIIIAVIVIFFLVLLLFKLYYNNLKDKDLETAKATLEGLNNAINGDKNEFVILGPTSFRKNRWSLSVWPRENIKPIICSNWNRCICICAFDPRIEFKIPSLSERCSLDGVCLELKKPISISESDPTILKLFRLQDIIYLNNPPISLKIEKGVITRAAE